MMEVQINPDLLKHELLSFSRYKICHYREILTTVRLQSRLDHSSGDAIVYMDGDLQDPLN